MKIELLKKCLNGDDKAMEELFSETYQKAYYTALSVTKNKTDAEDAIQESYIKVYKNLPKLNDLSKFNSWFNMIVVNTAKNIVIKKRPLAFSQLDREEQNIIFEDTIENRNETFNPEKVSDKNATIEIMAEIINSLSDNQRLCVQLFYFEDMKISEIAESLSVSENTVKSRLRLAKGKIEKKVKELEKEGIKLYGTSFIPSFFRLSSENTKAPQMDIYKIIKDIDKPPSTATKNIPKKEVAEKAVAKSVTGGKIAKRIVVGVLAVSVAAGGTTYYLKTAKENAKPVENVTETTEVSTTLGAEQQKNVDEAMKDTINYDSENIAPALAVEYGDYIYSVAYNENGRENGIYKSKKNSTEKEKILAVTSVQLFIYKDTLFYVDENQCAIYSIDLKTDEVDPTKISEKRIPASEYDSMGDLFVQKVYMQKGKLRYLCNKEGYPTESSDTSLYEYDCSKNESKMLKEFKSGEKIYTSQNYAYEKVYCNNGYVTDTYDENDKLVSSEADEDTYNYSANVFEDDKYIVVINIHYDENANSTSKTIITNKTTGENIVKDFAVGKTTILDGKIYYIASRDIVDEGGFDTTEEYTVVENL